MTDSAPAPPRTPLRTILLVVTALETLFFLYLLIGGLTDTLPFAKGYGGPAATLATLVFLPFVLPALGLAIANRALTLAAILAGIGGVLYAYDPLLRFTSLFEGSSTSVTVILGLGLVAIGLWAAVRGIRGLRRKDTA